MKSLQDNLNPTLNEIDIDQAFEENLKEIQDEIAEVDKLYKEIKEHYDSIRDAEKGKIDFNSSFAPKVNTKNLTFVTKQTENLISLKNLKISLLNNKTTISKNKVELSLKVKNAQDKNRTERDRSDLVSSIVSELMVNLKPSSVKKETSIIDVEPIDDNDILNTLFSNDKETKHNYPINDEINSMKIDTRIHREIVVDIKGKPYAINHSNEILFEYDFKVEIENLDGLLYDKNSGKNFEIIEPVYDEDGNVYAIIKDSLTELRQIPNYPIDEFEIFLSEDESEYLVEDYNGDLITVEQIQVEN